MNNRKSFYRPGEIYVSTHHGLSKKIGEIILILAAPADEGVFSQYGLGLEPRIIMTSTGTVVKFDLDPFVRSRL